MDRQPSGFHLKDLRRPARQARQQADAQGTIEKSKTSRSEELTLGPRRMFVSKGGRVSAKSRVQRVAWWDGLRCLRVYEWLGRDGC